MDRAKMDGILFMICSGIFYTLFSVNSWGYGIFGPVAGAMIAGGLGGVVGLGIGEWLHKKELSLKLMELFNFVILFLAYYFGSYLVLIITFVNLFEEDSYIVSIAPAVISIFPSIFFLKRSIKKYSKKKQESLNQTI